MTEQTQLSSGERQTYDLWPDTGRILGLSRGATYEAARRGEIPVLRFGKRLLVPKKALDQLLKSTQRGA